MNPGNYFYRGREAACDQSVRHIHIINMGAVLSWWKGKTSTVEILEGIDKDIQALEEYREKYQRRLKTWVGRLLLYSSLLYLFTCALVYFWYMPVLFVRRLALCLAFLIFPLLVWLLRKMLIMIFSLITEKNNEKLEDLTARKRKILEEVMETETYKNAKLILERFDLDSNKKLELESPSVARHMPVKPGQELRQRHVILNAPLVTASPVSVAVGRPPPASEPTLPGRASHSAPGGPPERNLSTVAAQQSLMRKPVTSGTPVPGFGMHPPGPPLARPVPPRERGLVDRVVEYLVGDGPQNRYALICQQCLSHNGMALKEEFEYTAFRCAYCYFLNPARKTRPQAPRFPEFAVEPKLSPDDHVTSSATEENDEPPVSDTQEAGIAAAPAAPAPAAAAAELSCASDGPTTPESQDLPSEKSDEEQDLSAMEVE